MSNPTSAHGDQRDEWENGTATADVAGYTIWRANVDRDEAVVVKLPPPQPFVVPTHNGRPLA